MQTAVLDRSEWHTPRRAGFLSLIETGGGIVKLNGITTTGWNDLNAELIDAIKAVFAKAYDNEAAPNHLGAGFAIVHRGEEAVWLLLHWWLPGGIASHRLWRAELSSPKRFSIVPPGLLACAWELGAIDFERRAWIATAMAGKPVADYFESRMPWSEV
jgi:hypothetical protein